ncbi:MAG: hypothetical protein WC422_02210 [Candidatus Paceibacterota bacterium]|jgi:hypothetical protein
MPKGIVSLIDDLEIDCSFCEGSTCDAGPECMCQAEGEEEEEV